MTDEVTGDEASRCYEVAVAVSLGGGDQEAEYALSSDLLLLLRLVVDAWVAEASAERDAMLEGIAMRIRERRAPAGLNGANVVAVSWRDGSAYDGLVGVRYSILKGGQA